MTWKHWSTLSVAALSAATLASCGGEAPSGPSQVASNHLSDVKHVFVIVLENEAFDATFGNASSGSYLADTLPAQGLLLRQYYGVAHNSTPNYIAMISGLAPNAATQSDCRSYVDFALTSMASDGQPVGQGCVYPSSIPTVAAQLEAKGLTWKAYFEDMGNDPKREPSTCGHVPLGTTDVTATAEASDQYAQRHNPFVYFHSVIDSSTCARNDVSLASLAGDLSSADRTANLTFIAPNLCHNGHDTPCKNGEPGGLRSIDAFLRQWVPRITSSPAFQANGMLVITFDESSSGDASACCDELPGPNTRLPGGTGPGGGRVGALVLSPFVSAGSVSDAPYNHYSLLRSVEDVFGLPYLGYAHGVSSFEIR
jgi:phospholipase C